MRDRLALWLRPGSICALALLLAGLTCAAQTVNNGAQTNRLQHGRDFLGLPPTPDAAAAAQGQKLFVENCGFCHGERATGGEGPDLVRSSVVLHDEGGNQIGNVVLHGRPDRGMPAFPSFSADQIHAIAAFLHARVEESANRYGYKLLNVVTGNAAEGQKFFEQHCTSCHSVTKDLQHVASRFEPSDLQAQFLMPSTSLPTKVTVRLPSGETVEGKLKRIDDFTVSLWDTDGDYREFGRSRDVSVEVHSPLQGHQELLPLYTNADMHNVLAYLVTLK